MKIQMILIHAIFALFIAPGALWAADLGNSSSIKKRINESDLTSPRSPKKRKTNARINILPYHEIMTIKEVSADEIIALEGTTLVFWDLDRTLVRRKFLISDLPPDERDGLIDKVLAGALMDERNANHQEAKKFLVYLETDKRFLDFVRMEYANQLLMAELHKRGAIVVGLTARNKRGAGFTDSSLDKLGIDFAKLSNLGYSRLDFTEEASFINGIFYTGNSERKVEFIPKLVSQISERLNMNGPFTVFHFDDSEEEIGAFGCRNFESLSVSDDITITPIYYRAHDFMLNIIAENPKFIAEEIKKLYKDFCAL